MGIRINRHSSFKGFTFGLAFAGMGMLFLLISAMRTDLNCARLEPRVVNCTMQSSLLGFFAQPGRLASHVQEAVVAESCDSDGCTYRVELVTPNGRTAVTSVYSSGYEDKQRTADQINQYVNSTAVEPLEIRTNLGMGWFILIPLLFVFIGLGTIAYRLGIWVTRLIGWR